MNHPQMMKTAGWMTLGALLALAPQLAGCDTTPDHEALHESTKKSEGRATIVTETESAARGKTDERKVEAMQEPTGSAGVAEKDEEPVKAEKADDVDVRHPTVKRLVIASDVNQREPVEIQEAKLKQPVVAFVELAYEGQNEAGVVVTFEHDTGKKVGFVELSVPAQSPRYRTWARTHNITEPGTWTAVVTNRDGEELARKSFTVTG